MPDFFTNFYDAVIKSEIASVFAVVMIVLFLAASIVYSRHRMRDPQQSQMVARSTPNLLVSVGILGTFVGIFVGLFDFDVNDIDGSIPPLLKGLTIAFTTSIIGMTFALLFKGYVFALPHNFGERRCDP